MHRTIAALGACLLLLSACAGATGGASGSRIPSGGSAGQMGAGYCQTLPSDLNARSQWNKLCFPSD